MAIRPIFIFSITRSGSTLVQRVIAAHDGVATASEPWLLLPLLYTTRERGVVAEYTHPLLATALEDFCEVLPAGPEDYRRELHDLVIRLYTKAADGEGAQPDRTGTDRTRTRTGTGTDQTGRHTRARYFLDKSPPYYFIAEEIMRLFPEGKFIFLWRNPLSILASIIQTWQGGRWRVTACRADLFIGLPRLVRAYRANRSVAHAVRLEDLLSGGEDHWRALMGYLEIEFDPSALERFGEVSLNGRMGDRTGVHRYATLDSEPVDKWKRVLANPLRRAWARRYLRFLGQDRLAIMGYDARALARELDAQPVRARSLVPDVCGLAIDLLKEPLRAHVRSTGIGGPNPIRELLEA